MTSLFHIYFLFFFFFLKITLHNRNGHEIRLKGFPLQMMLSFDVEQHRANDFSLDPNPNPGVSKFFSLFCSVLLYMSNIKQMLFQLKSYSYLDNPWKKRRTKFAFSQYKPLYFYTPFFKYLIVFGFHNLKSLIKKENNDYLFISFLQDHVILTFGFNSLTILGKNGEQIFVHDSQALVRRTIKLYQYVKDDV